MGWQKSGLAGFGPGCREMQWCNSLFTQPISNPVTPPPGLAMCPGSDQAAATCSGATASSSGATARPSGESVPLHRGAMAERYTAAVHSATAAMKAGKVRDRGRRFRGRPGGGVQGQGVCVEGRGAQCLGA